MAADPTLQISTTVLAFHTRTHSSTLQPSTIFALHIHLGHRPIPIKLQLATRTPIRSASPEYGRWLTWLAKRTAKTNLPTSQRTLVIHITLHPAARFCLHWPHGDSIIYTILTCVPSCTAASMGHQQHTWPVTLTTLQFSSLINEPLALH